MKGIYNLFSNTNTIKENLRLLVRYFLALIIVTIIVIYIFDVPTKLTGATKLVREYYYDNAVSSFIIDIFLVAGYLLLGSYFIYKLNIKKEWQKIITIILTSIGITSFFIVLFKYLGIGDQRSFFHRWFNKVGFLAAIYDAILLSSVYLTMRELNRFL